MELKQRTLTNYSVELASDAEGDKPAVVHIKARGKDCVYACPLREYEDFEGMNAPEVITLNIDHDTDKTIGKAYNFALTEYGLECDAEIYPSLHPEAPRVIEMLKHGLPLQASITFTTNEQDDIDLVEEGQKASVNGFEVDGPAFIYRRWNLRSLAICIHGADNSTTVEAVSLSQEKFKELLKMKKQRSEEEKPVVDDEEKKVENADEQTQTPEETPTEGSDVEARLSAIEQKLDDLANAVAALQATSETETDPVKIEESDDAKEDDEEKKELSKKIETLEASIKNLAKTVVKNYNAERAENTPIGYPADEQCEHDPRAGSRRFCSYGLTSSKK